MEICGPLGYEYRFDEEEPPAVPRWKNVLQTSEEVYRLKRSAVLREATRIFARRGYHDTSLDEIAEALQVSKGTLYNYVEDKQEILFECHKMALDVGDQAIAFADANATTGYARLRLMLRAYLTWLNGALGGGGVASDVTALRPSDRKTVIVRRDSVQDRMVAYIERGIADGSLRKVDARLAVYTIMGAVNAVQSWYSPDGRLTMTAIADTMVDLLLHGMAGPGAGKTADVPIPVYGATEETVAEEPARASKRKPAAAKSAARRRSARATPG
jgi:AcrR family transcriptional regulator